MQRTVPLLAQEHVIGVDNMARYGHVAESEPTNWPATFHPGGGYERILPYAWDADLGRQLALPPAHRADAPGPASR